LLPGKQKCFPINSETMFSKFRILYSYRCTNMQIDEYINILFYYYFKIQFSVKREIVFLKHVKRDSYPPLPPSLIWVLYEPFDIFSIELQRRLHRTSCMPCNLYNS
jgi:hypothetical protein